MPSPRSRLLPGERDRGTLTLGISGAFGGPHAGAPLLPQGPSTMDAATTAERKNEGGGAAGQRLTAR